MDASNEVYYADTLKRRRSSRKFPIPVARYPSSWLPVVTLLLDLQPVAGPRTFRDGGKSSKRGRGNPKLLGCAFVRSRCIVLHPRRSLLTGREPARYAEIRSWKDMTYDVGRGEASGPYIRGRRAVNCPLPFHVRESNRADMKPWNASACNSSQFMIHSRFIGELAETWISNQAGRSFFNCDVQFGAKEFSERRGSRFGFESTKL